jgi:hypothetical protein
MKLQQTSKGDRGPSDSVSDRNAGRNQLVWQCHTTQPLDLRQQKATYGMFKGRLVITLL